MPNKIAVKGDFKKNDIKSPKPVVSINDKEKQKKITKKSSGIVPDAVGRSAVNQVKASSSRDVRGSSGLANTGTIISYD